jgi:hypothetical protein
MFFVNKLAVAVFAAASSFLGFLMSDTKASGLKLPPTNAVLPQETSRAGSFLWEGASAPMLFIQITRNFRFKPYREAIEAFP